MQKKNWLSKNNLFMPFFTKKQAQITSFIIIGIVLLAIFSFALIMKSFNQNTLIEKQVNLDSDFLIVQSQIQSCFEKVSSDAIQYVFKNGFYYKSPEQLSKGGSTLWLYKTINIMPSDFDFITNETEAYIEDYFPICFPVFELEKNGFGIGEYSPKANVEINNNSISFDLELDLDVSYGETIKNFDSFSYSENINFYHLYDQLTNFVNNQLLKPDFNFKNPFLNWANLEENKDFTYEYVKINETILKFKITDLSGILIQGNPIQAGFSANFETNDLIRYYDKGSYTLYSPDRVVNLFFINGSPIDISIRAYMKDFVVREKTTYKKTNEDVTAWKDIEIETNYPIYRFGPNGAKFEEDTFGILGIYLNNDQILTNWLGYNYSKPNSETHGLLYHGKEGWIPFPHKKNHTINVDSGVFLSSAIFGFSEFTALDCNNIPFEDFYVTSEETRSLLQTILPIILIIAAVLLVVVMGPMMMSFAQSAFAGSFSTVTVLGITATSYAGIVAATIVGLAIFAGAVIFTAKLAMDGFKALDAEKTIIFSTVCGGEFTVENSKCSGGSCDCILNEIAQEPKEISLPEGHHLSEPSKTYTLTSTVEIKWPKTKGVSECKVSGQVITNLDKETIEKLPTKTIEEFLNKPLDWDLPPPEYYLQNKRENTGNFYLKGLYSFEKTLLDSLKKDLVYANYEEDSFKLGCCKSNQGYCLDNYLGSYCDGKMEYKSCFDIPTCPNYINFSKIFNSFFYLPTGEYCSFITGTDNPSLDIYVAGMDYNKTENYIQDSSSLILKLFDKQNLGKINFYRVEKTFNSSQENNIDSFADEQCMGIAPKRLTIVLHNGQFECSQAYHVIDTPALISFKKELNAIYPEEFTGSFCYYINNLHHLKPPKVIIKDVERLEGKAKLSFIIEDEQDPVFYSIYTKPEELGNSAGLKIPNSEGNASPNTLIQREVFLQNYPSRNVYYIRAMDQEGQISESNEKIVVIPGIIFGFNNIAPLLIGSDGYTINFDEYLDLIDTGEIIRRKVTSSNLDCLTVAYSEYQSGGLVSLTPKKSNCESFINVEIETTAGFVDDEDLRVIVE